MAPRKPAGQALAQGIAAIGLQQLFARLIPFFLHTVANNYISPEDASLGSVKFQLLAAIVYSLGREGFRRGCLRGDTEAAVLRTACALWPFWLLASTLTCALFALQNPLNAQGAPQPGYRGALVNYWVAFLVEAAMEPLYILGTYNVCARLEVVSEVFGRIAGSTAFALSVVSPSIRSPPAIAFSRGQLSYSLVMAAFYFGHACLNARHLYQVLFIHPLIAPAATPGTQGTAGDQCAAQDGSDAVLEGTLVEENCGYAAPKTGLSAAPNPGLSNGESGTGLVTGLVLTGLVIDDAATESGCPKVVAAYARVIRAAPQPLWMCAVFSWQAVQKMVLQEASKFATDGYSAHVAGVYGEVQNLGSLVVRIIFWPIESSAFRAFSRLPATHKNPPPSPSKTSSTTRPPSARLDPGLRLLSILTRLVVLVALITCAFGPNYSFAVIHLLISATWSRTEAPAVLAAYCGYLVFMSVNGVLEAYVHATLDARGLARSNAFMVAATLLHAAIIAGTRWVAEDCMLLLAADCFNMALRIAFCVASVRRQHAGRSFGGAAAWVPTLRSFAVLVAAFVVTLASNRVMLRRIGGDADALARVPMPMVVHVLLGAVICLATLGALWVTEARLRRDARAALKDSVD